MTVSWWQQINFFYFITTSLLVVIILLSVLLYFKYKQVQWVKSQLTEAIDAKAKSQLVLETRVAERTHSLQESSMTLSLRSKQLEKSLTALAIKNEELKRLDKLKDEFIATVSHELRTPLTAIRGSIGLIAQEVIKPNSVAYKNLVNTAQDSSERLAKLINDLLDLQKFAAGTFSLDCTKFDLYELAKQSIYTLQPYAARYAVKLIFNTLNDKPIFVYADNFRIQQVMDNLVSNAIKFSPEQSEVRVDLLITADKVTFKVTDFGIGIPNKFKANLFQNFYQVDSSNSRAKEGTGLGLAICKKIIENHQGEIGFESESDQGSQFWFKLPLAT
ncbi:sensor histidine kinase [Rheinheimera sp. WS51]|uniref:sensor histidine kinase n=1 Tax=Rheinheimera sp. WS51 TaxID=3425886 RepID=UPI003D8C9A7C